jgi:hypothetical protein
LLLWRIKRKRLASCIGTIKRRAVRHLRCVDRLFSSSIPARLSNKRVGHSTSILLISTISSAKETARGNGFCATWAQGLQARGNGG